MVRATGNGPELTIWCSYPEGYGGSEPKRDTRRNGQEGWGVNALRLPGGGASPAQQQLKFY